MKPGRLHLLAVSMPEQRSKTERIYEEAESGEKITKDPCIRQGDGKILHGGVNCLKEKTSEKFIVTEGGICNEKSSKFS